MKLFKPVAPTDNDLANLIFIYLGDSSNEISGDFKLFVLCVSCGPTLISTRCFVVSFERFTVSRIVGIDGGIFMRNLKRNMGKYIK